MCSTDRSKALLDIFRQGLCHFDQVQSSAMLGDRHSYIGMSDIGRYLDCPRHAIASKLMLKRENLNEQFILQRGHWFENGVGVILGHLGLKKFHQLEIDCRMNDIPMKAHLDFTLVWQQPALAVRVLEIKSMGQIPPTPYQAHEMQVSAQTSLLQNCWRDPVFSLRDGNGILLEDHLSFPEICHKQLGISLPNEPDQVSIEGWLLYLSMKDTQAFGPYVHNEAMFRIAHNQATQFWSHLEACKTGTLSLKDMPYAKGFHPLCAYCHVNADCPKFQASEFQPQWETAIAKLDNLKQDKAFLDAEIKEIESMLKLACNNSPADTWINTEGHRFRLASVKGRRTLDRGLLRQQLCDLFDGFGIENMNVDDFIASCEKEGEPGARLYINPVN